MERLSLSELEEFYRAFYEVSQMALFESDEVPDNLRVLIHYAEFWGVSDDWTRQELALQAPEDVQKNLRSVVEEYGDDLDDWLSGSEAALKNPSDAYIAFSAMRMAADFM